MKYILTYQTLAHDRGNMSGDIVLLEYFSFSPT